MGETSKEYTPEELEFLESMKVLIEHPRFEQLVAGIREARETYALNLARHMALTGGARTEPVDQREIDYKRGFWNGALYAVTQFPRQKAKSWDKFVAEQTKESDAS